MRTETITRKIYTFDELSDRAKDRARDWWRGSALCHGWWEFIYDDAERVGLKITGFDLDRSRHATGEFIDSAHECAEKIMQEFPSGNLWSDANAFLKERAAFLENAEKDEWGELATLALENELEEMESEFLREILEDFSLILQAEYEFQLSDESADDAIRANEYEFTEEGKIV